MPSFATLAVKDLPASAHWYQDALGFAHVFTIAGPSGMPLLVHLRWAKYADLLLRQESGPGADAPKGVGITLTFNLLSGGVDDLADRARRHGARIIGEPQNQPWNARDFSVADPDGFVVTFSQGPVDPGMSMEQVIARATRRETP